MSSRNFLPIASSGGVTLFAPSKSFISFTNSPYYSHEHGSAVDIYPLLNEPIAGSPVRGQLVFEFRALELACGIRLFSGALLHFLKVLEVWLPATYMKVARTISVYKTNFMNDDECMRRSLC